MTETRKFYYEPLEHETEGASYSYLMSILSIAIGLPLPIVNLLTTILFYIGNRKKSYFVRWHCTQALVSQMSLFCINTVSFWWTVSIFFGNNTISNNYIAYIIVVVITNSIEFFGTIYTMSKVRQGKHVSWFFYGYLTDKICKP